MPRRTLLTFVFVVALFASLSAHAVQAGSSQVETDSVQSGVCTVDISYQGYDNVHLAYQTAGCAGTPPYRLVVSTGGVTTTLAMVSGSGTYHHLGLSNGQTYAYSLSEDNGTPVSGSNGVTLNGLLNGTLLFDETVEKHTLTAGKNVINIPDAISFSLRESIVSGEFDLITSGTGMVHISQSTLNGYTSLINHGSTTDLSIYVQDSQFTDFPVAIGAVSFVNNEFRRQVFLLNRSASVFTGNVFEDGIYLDCASNDSGASICDWGAAGPEPVIDGNSFVGPRALFSNQLLIPSVNPPLTIGRNYYGSFDGFDKVVNPYPARKGFLYQRAALIQDTTLANMPENYDSYGKFITHLKPSASSIFLHSWIAGQNSLSHIVNINGDDQYNPVGILGRPTLLSLDIGTTFSELSNVRVFVKYNGTEISKSDITLTHTRQDCTGPNADKCTVNFILPAVPPSGNPYEDLRFEVYVDMSNVPGAEAGLNNVRLTGGNIRLLAPPARKFKIEIVPVNMGGFCSGKGNTSEVESIVRDYVPSMFPLRPQDLQVTVRAPRSYYCASPLAMSATLVGEGVLGELAASDKLFVTDPPDLVVAVVPSNSMNSWVSNSIQGMSLPFLRNVILVSDAFPFSVLHEMGHQAGLWVSPEQYDKYPPSGLPLGAMTAFDPEGKRVKTMSGQIEHFPAVGHAGWRPSRIYDIMSNMDITIWPLADSWKTLLYYYNNLLKATQPVQPLSAVENQSTEGMRTLYIFGDVERIPNTFEYHFSYNKLGLFDLTGTGMNPGDSPEAVHYLVSKEPYKVVGYDGSGNPIYTTTIYSYSTYAQDYFPDYAYNYHTLQVPLAVARVRITDNWNNRVMLDASTSGPVNSHFLTPLSGMTLGSTLTLSWTDPAPGVWHLLAYSSDNGATWQPLKGVPMQGSTFTIPTDLLPSGSQLAFRLYSSDGFEGSMDTVNNLKLPNRPPQVSIGSPLAGLKVPSGTPLALEAYAFDLEDGGIKTGAWTSSLDGSLGDGAYLPAVLLSPGTHTLTFTTTDTQGAAASAQVSVTVGTVTQADLKLAEHAIQLFYPGRAIGSVDPFSLSKDVEYTLTVDLAGYSVDMTATLALYAHPDGGSETLVTRADVDLPAFSTGRLTATYTPPVNGGCTFRAVIEAANLPDPNPGNNQASLVISSPPPTYRISGRVADQHNAPIPGAVVSDGAGRFATTDDGGLYTIDGFAPGPVTLTVSHSNYGITPSSRAVTVGAANVDGVDFSGAALTFSILGQVRDEDSHGVAGVVVSDGAGQSDITGEGGGYLLTGVLPGTYVVTAISSHYLFTPVWRDVTISQDDAASLDFVATYVNKIYLPYLGRQ